MAFIQEDTKNKDELPGSSSDSSPIVGSSTSSTATPKQGSGSFTNINKYVEANKPQVGNLTSGISDKINKEAQGVNSGLTQAQNSFQTQYNPEKSRIDSGESYINNSIQKAQQGQRLSGDDLNKYAQYRENQGPILQTDSSLNDLQQKATNAQNLSGMTQTSSGRQQLLSDTFASPTYSTGQKRLDQLLLQSTPGTARDLINSANTATNGLSDKVGQEAGNEQQSIADINARRSALQQLAGGQAQSLTSGFENQLRQSLATQQAAREGQVSQAKTDIDKAINEGRFSDASNLIKSTTGQDVDTSGYKNADYFTRGLDDYWKGQFLGGQRGDINDYLNMQKQSLTPYLANSEQLNLNTATSANDRAKYQALADLAGLGSSQRILSEQNSTPSAAGAFNAGSSKSAIDNMNALRDKINKNLQSTYSTYQQPDEDAFKVMQELMKGAIPNQDSRGVVDGTQATPENIADVMGRAGVTDRSAWDRALTDMTNGVSSDDINSQLAKFAQLRAQR